jgi:hypothetical protein
MRGQWQGTANAALKRALMRPARFFNQNFLYVSRLDMAFARGALNAATRTVDPARPVTWEFGAFSQNGEDGIVEHLLSLLAMRNQYFIEIGASDGLENNSSYFALGKKYSGMMVEADEVKSGNASRLLQPLNWSVHYLNMLVTPDNTGEVVGHALYRDPDFFSLDIDGNDYHVLRGCFDAGLTPRVVCVEYNSAFGPDNAVTIPYTPGFDYHEVHPTGLYYGASVSAWRGFLEPRGYRFVTVDSRGVNAFFVLESALAEPEASWEALTFAENAAQLMRTGLRWEEQYGTIQHLPLVEV